MLPLEREIATIETETNRLTAHIVDARQGRVTADMLSLDQLNSAFLIAVDKFRLRPFFDHIENYYPILSTTLTHRAILVHIPFTSGTAFHAWEIIPFPLQTDTFMVTIDKQHEIMIVSEDYLLLDTANLNTLTKCTKAYLDLYICPAYIFAFTTATDTPCEISLIQTTHNNTVKECSYKLVPHKTVYHANLKGIQYFYFPNTTGITLICLDDIKRVQVQGYYTVPDHCELRSNTLATLPTRQHLAFMANMSSNLHKLTNLPSVNVSTIHVNSDETKLLTLMNKPTFSEALDMSLPWYVSRGSLASLISVPTVLCFVFACVVVYYLRTRGRVVTRPQPAMQVYRRPVRRGIPA